EGDLQPAHLKAWMRVFPGVARVLVECLRALSLMPVKLGDSQIAMAQSIQDTTCLHSVIHQLAKNAEDPEERRQILIAVERIIDCECERTAAMERMNRDNNATCRFCVGSACTALAAFGAGFAALVIKQHLRDRSA
ncbi:MAG: hypothetical protein KGY40_07940, partial [Thioalkalivibrio sp.]|nr:hypothetical protein [Thioalkalivibrio sp.]